MSKVRPHPVEGTFQMQNTARRLKVVVSADGPGTVSGAGALLLVTVLPNASWTMTVTAGVIDCVDVVFVGC